MMRIETQTDNSLIAASNMSSISASTSPASATFSNSNMDANNNTITPLESNSKTLAHANNNNNNTMNSGASMLTDHNGVSNYAEQHADMCTEENAKTNLIVNYLPQNMTQEEIKQLFSSIGPVDTCKLIKDKLTGQSLGYAFVNFVQQEDADKAVCTLNSMRLQNKTIKVSFARPSSDQIKGANLYVCGLTKEFTQEELESMFIPFGTIISSKILTDPKTGESKGVGFVRFDKRGEAEYAIAALNGKKVDPMPEPLVVKFANTPTSAKSVMGIPLAPFITTCRSAGFFQPYRPQTNGNYRYSPMSAAYCPETNTILHHTTAAAPALAGLIQSATSNQNIAAASSNGASALPVVSVLSAGATAAAPCIPPQLISPPPTSLSNTSLSSISYSGWCIFVYNLGPEADESILWQLFGPFGAVQSVKVIRDNQTQKCKGFGFVTMTNYEEAITAINCLNGFNLQNRILQVSFKTNGTNKQMF